MACFIVREMGQPDRRFDIVKELTIVGRGRDAELILPNSGVSKQHLKILHDGEETRIQNISSKNPTLLNGDPVDNAMLKSFDHLHISRFTLIYFANPQNPIGFAFEGKRVLEYPDYNRNSSKNRDDATFKMSAATVQKLAAREHLLRNVKIIGPDESTVPEKGLISFGKGGDIPVSGWLITGIAAEVEWSGTAHLLRKIAGFISVKVNGEKIKEEHLLVIGDSFQIGGTVFRYDFD
jgi:hypothetical protein